MRHVVIGAACHSLANLIGQVTCPINAIQSKGKRNMVTATTDKTVKPSPLDTRVKIDRKLNTRAGSWTTAITADATTASDKVKEHTAFGILLDDTLPIFPTVNAIVTTTAEAEDKLFDKWFAMFGKYFGGQKMHDELRKQWNKVRRVFWTIRGKHAESESTAKLVNELQNLKRNCMYYHQTGQTESAKLRGNASEASKTIATLRTEFKPTPTKLKVTSATCRTTVKKLKENLGAEKKRLIALRKYTVDKEQNESEKILQSAIENLTSVIAALTSAKVKKV